MSPALHCFSALWLTSGGHFDGCVVGVGVGGGGVVLDDVVVNGV